jgi:multidrug efflux pump subunit AcrB
VSDIAQKTPGVQTVMGIVGFDLLGGGNKTNTSTLFIPLKPWEVRPDAPAARVAREVASKSAPLRDGMVIAFNPAAIRGLGTAGGFELYLQARTDPDPRRLFLVTQAFLEDLRRTPSSPRSIPSTGPRCRSSGSRSTARRRCRSACRSRTSSMPCRAPWRRST